MKKIAKYYKLLNVDLLFLTIIVPQFAWFLLTFTDLERYYEGSPYINWPNQACVIAAVFCFFSLVRHTTVFNEPLRESYRAMRPRGLLAKLGFLFSNRLFYIKVAILIACYMFLPLDFTLKSLADLSKEHHIVEKVVLVVVGFLIAIPAHLSAYRYWDHHPQKEKYSKKLYDRNGTAIAGIYILGAYALAIVVPNVINLWPIIKEILSFELIVPIVILLLLPFVIRSARAWRKRHSFLKELKKTCAEKCVIISPIKAPYRSLFFVTDEESFRVSLGERQYSCKLIAGLKRGVPLIVHEDGTLSFLHRLRIRGGTLFQYEVQHHCVYDADCSKILIVNPTPKKLYTMSAGNMIEIDNGFTVGGYKVFTASGFLRAVEMDTLHR